MIKVDFNVALRLHELVASVTGGSVGIRDKALLESALESPFLTFGGEDLYATLEAKGARLGCSLISNHAFVDGNKRIGTLIMLTFLEMNDVHLNLTNEDVEFIAMSVAKSDYKYEDVLNWIEEKKN